ncbi:hypothetical protein ON010_g7464 [Phytophthora cinnamomi]|nr:hypothetical protein ON010_g7464 [Phytophthora cinnamomi]
MVSRSSGDRSLVFTQGTSRYSGWPGALYHESRRQGHFVAITAPAAAAAAAAVSTLGLQRKLVDVPVKTMAAALFSTALSSFVDDCLASLRRNVLLNWWWL